jgi:ABC-2 type transport system ATP-binding protein
MIKVDSLNFEYPGVLALDDVSLSVKAGNITALVGPNGAGKTTLLRCLAALEHPLSGFIRISGIDILKNPRVCHRKVGYLCDFFGLYEDLTVKQCLSYVAAARGVEQGKRENSVLLSAKRLGIEGQLASKANTLSRGLRQRLAIAQAIIHDPEVLLLDEPASGLDPEARGSLAELFLGLASKGMTLLVSSHILSELDEYSTDMIILEKGKILSHELVRGREVTSSTMRLSLTEPAGEFLGRLSEIDGVSALKADGLEVLFNYTDDATAQRDLLKRLVDSGLPVRAFTDEKTNMHNVYLHKLRQGKN